MWKMRSPAADARRPFTALAFCRPRRWLAITRTPLLSSCRVVSEPWGLVVNEAAASGLPLLVSERAGSAATLVPDPPGTTGSQFDPLDLEEMTTKLAWMAGLTEEDRRAMGRRAALVVADWGPDRFAHGAIEAIRLARHSKSRQAHTPVTADSRS